MIRIINSIIILSIFFPYFTVLSPEQHYTQPYPVLLCLLGICINIDVKLLCTKIRIPCGAMNYFFYLVVSVLIFFATLQYNTSLALRDLYGYLSLIIIALVVYMIASADFELLIRVVKFSIVIWTGVGFIQTCFAANFLNRFIGDRPIDHLIGSGRGVTSLSPEPTHFGLIMGTFLFAGIYLKLPKWYYFLCIISIIFFSKSSSAVLFLMMVIGTVCIISKPFKCIPLFICIFLIGYLASGFELINSLYWRFVKLLKVFFSDPVATIMNDESVRIRLNSMWLPMYASFKNVFIPYGFNPDSWATQVDILEVQFGSFIANLDKERIGAALPMMVFQTGFFSIVPVLPVLIARFIYGKPISLLVVFSFFWLGLQYISPAFTMLGFLLGLLFYDVSQPQKTSTLDSNAPTFSMAFFKKIIEAN